VPECAQSKQANLLDLLRQLMLTVADDLRNLCSGWRCEGFVAITGIFSEHKWSINQSINTFISRHGTEARVPAMIPFAINSRPTTSSWLSNPLSASPLAPQIRLWLTIVRVYKLYLLTYLLTYLCRDKEKWLKPGLKCVNRWSSSTLQRKKVLVIY